MEKQRDHALDRPEKQADFIWNEEEGLIVEANRLAKALSTDDQKFEALTSAAEFEHVLLDAQQFGFGSDGGGVDKHEYLVLPVLFDLE